jgi:hypothetical protein
MGTLNLRVLIQAVDKATSPLRGVSRGLSGLVRPAKMAGRVMLDLGRDMFKMALMGTAAVTAIGAGIWTLVRRTADQGDAALLASQKTGVQIEAYQRLAYAAKLANVEAEGLDTGLKFLNASIDAAGQGSKQDAKAFGDMGISLKDTEGQLRATEDILIDVADRFEKMPDGPRKTALAMAIFGRSGVDMIPMLNEGGAAIRKWGEEAQAAGLILSEQAAKDADAFNDSLDRLKMGVFGMGNTLVSDLMPQLTGAIEYMRTFILANKPAIIAKMTEVFQDLAAAAPPIIDGLVSIIGFLGQLARVIGPIIEATGGWGQILDALALIMLVKVGVAIWSAVAAVWGLNGAMYANPIGLVILAVVALIAIVFVLVRNWGTITRIMGELWDKLINWVTGQWTKFVNFFKGIGAAMSSAFRGAIDALWNMIPGWLRKIMTGAAFALRVVGNGLNGGAPGGGGPGGGRPPAPRPQLPGGGSAQVGGRIVVGVDRSGAPRVRSATSNNRAVPLVVQDSYRGSGVD